MKQSIDIGHEEIKSVMPLKDIVFILTLQKDNSRSAIKFIVHVYAKRLIERGIDTFYELTKNSTLNKPSCKSYFSVVESLQNNEIYMHMYDFKQNEISIFTFSQKPVLGWSFNLKKISIPNILSIKGTLKQDSFMCFTHLNNYLVIASEHIIYYVDFKKETVVLKQVLTENILKIDQIQ